MKSYRELLNWKLVLNTSLGCPLLGRRRGFRVCGANNPKLWSYRWNFYSNELHVLVVLFVFNTLQRASLDFAKKEATTRLTQCVACFPWQVLGTVATVLFQDHEGRHTEFQQLPYHRIFIMLLVELNQPEPILEAINFQVLQTFRWERKNLDLVTVTCLV